MRILVTGGGGFLGSSVCRQLSSLGHDVIAYQRRPAGHLASFGVRSVCGEITDIGLLLTSTRGCDAVVHTAGKAGIWGDRSEFDRVNVKGTSCILEACRNNAVPHLVFTSSPSIVHSGGDVGGVDESIPVATNIKAPYPASKAEAERLVLAANSHALKTTALRPHLIWGPGDPHILPRLAAKAKSGVIALPGPGKIVDTIFVENAALAHVKALQELGGEARCAGNPYFVTNNEPLPQGEIITRLLAAIGIHARVRAVPVWLAKAAGVLCEVTWKTFGLKSEPPVTRFSVEQLATAHWYDTRAAERDFGYLPATSIEEGLERLREQGI